VQDEPLSDQIVNAGVGTMPAVTLDGHALGSGLTPSALRKLILAKSPQAKPTPKPKAKPTPKAA
jgi:hypothetical protein